MTTPHPFKVVTVELLIPSDQGRGDVCGALRNIRDDNPICEYSILRKEEDISGPDAEERFDQPDLEYPGKTEQRALSLLARVAAGENLYGPSDLAGQITRLLKTAKG